MSVRAMVHGDSVRFRNGNMNIRFTSDEIKQIESDEFLISRYFRGCLRNWIVSFLVTNSACRIMKWAV